MTQSRALPPLAPPVGGGSRADASPEPALEGKVAIVTGATSGIGREVALGLANAGATTVVVGRGVERVRATAREIAEVSGNRSVESLAVSDLAVVGEVRKVARELRDRHPRLSILVNSAGAYYRRRQTTADGLERTFALNVLAPFLLTTELEDALRAGAPARVVQVASAAHRGHSVDFADLQSERRYRGFAVYGRSKLELLLLTREFGRRWPAREVAVNAVHPGFVRSGFASNNGRGTAVGFRILGSIFGISTRRGADTPLFVALSPGLAGTSGEYFVRRRPSPGSPASRDLAAAPRRDEAGAEIYARRPAGGGGRNSASGRNPKEGDCVGTRPWRRSTLSWWEPVSPGPRQRTRRQRRAPRSCWWSGELGPARRTSRAGFSIRTRSLACSRSSGKRTRPRSNGRSFATSSLS